MSSRLFTGLLVLSFHAVQGGLEGRIGAFPSASCVGLRDCSRPLCLRGGGADAKEAAEEDEYWSDNAEDLGNTDPKVNEAWERYLDEQRLRDPPEGSEPSIAEEDDTWGFNQQPGVRKNAGSGEGETNIRDRGSLAWDRDGRQEDDLPMSAEESEGTGSSSDSNRKYLDESADSNGVYQKSKFDDVHQKSLSKKEFQVSMDMLRRWHAEMKEEKLDDMKRNLLRGDTNAALQSIHQANIRSQDFKMTDLLEFGFKSLNDSYARGSGLLGLNPEEERRLLHDDKLTSQDLYRIYSGWDPMEIMEDFHQLEAKMNTIRVPAEVEDVRAAISLSLDMGKRLLISPGDYQWDDRMTLEHANSDIKLKLFGGDCVVENLKDFEVGGNVGAHTRLWGQWALNSGTWGTMYNASFIHELETRGGAALFIIVGGTAAFPWSFFGVQARCSGGVPILQAQTSFTSIIGSIVSGVSAHVNDSSTYSMVLMEQSHSILQASTLGYAEISGMRLLGDAVAVLDKSVVSDCNFGLKISDRCKLLLRNSTCQNNAVSAFYVEDDAEEDVQTASSMIQMVVAYSTVIPNTSDLAQTASMLPPSMMCRVWHQQVCPEILLEKGNNFLPLQNITTTEQLSPNASKSGDLFRSEILFEDSDTATKSENKPHSKAPHDLLLINRTDNRTGLNAYRKLQRFIDRNGCRKILARASEINSRNATYPFVFMTNLTGFVIINQETNEEVAAWDKIESGRRYEVSISCPSCNFRSRVRSGMTGKLRCNRCRAVFPREKTAAGVTCVGVDPAVEKCMREDIVGENIEEVDATTHALLPLPGNKFAVVRRPDQISLEQESNKTSKMSLAAELQEIRKKSAPAKQNKTSSNDWMDNMARLLEKGNVEWNSDVREKIFAAKGVQEDEQEHKKGEERRDEPEGPEMEKTEEDPGPQLTLMTGNTSGNALLDSVLKEHGVVMTGDDRPFGIRSPNDVRQEIQEDRKTKPAKDHEIRNHLYSDVESIARLQEHTNVQVSPDHLPDKVEGNEVGWSLSEDSSQVQKDIDQAYHKYKQSNPVDPQVVKEMWQYRKNLSAVENFTFDYNATKQFNFRKDAQILSDAYAMSRMSGDRQINLERLLENEEDEFEEEEYPADEDGIKGMEVSLLVSFRRQINSAEKFFRDVVSRKYENQEDKEKAGQQLRVHFGELGNLRKELYHPDEPWTEELVDRVEELKLHLKHLMQEIWIYCESGGFEEGEDVDIPAMMQRLRSYGFMK